MKYQQGEEQHRQRPEVRARARERVAANDLRGHVARRPEHTAADRPVDGHVVVVAYEDVAVLRVEEHVARRDVPITKTFGVQMEKGIGEVEAEDGKDLQWQLRFPPEDGVE